MAKVPVMGRVKTRLAREIGAVEATRFYRHALAAVLGRVARDSRWETSLAVAPDPGVASRALPASITRHAQGSGDLGRRMQRIMQHRAPGPLIIIGTDIPAITAAHIAAAFQALRGRDAVLGPAPDGGYWLVGLRRSPRILQPFRPVRWSSATTLTDTTANLAGCSIGHAARLSDVDTAADWHQFRNGFGRRVPLCT